MEIGTVRPVKIEDEMRNSYLDYAISVIVSRALPDVRDGLKPVQHRILYSCNGMGPHYYGSCEKSSRIVSEVLGKYHPHGDTAVYDAMVRMAQDFSMRSRLVDGQGNFGSVNHTAGRQRQFPQIRPAICCSSYYLQDQQQLNGQQASWFTEAIFSILYLI